MSENEKNLEKAPTWQERIARTGYNPKTDKNMTDTILYQLASLHDDRFYFWKCFINSFFDKKNDKKNDWKKTVCSRKMPYKKFEKMVVDRGNVWSKITLLNENGEEQYIFDASFGSLDVESDLDVVVYGDSVDIITDWIAFLKQNRPQNSTFSAYYDSNFYFEPSRRDSDGKLVSKAKIDVQKALTTGIDKAVSCIIPNKTDILDAMKFINDYADAYITQKPLQLEQSRARSKYATESRVFNVYPNPQSEKFGPQQEIEQYKAMEYFGHKCLLKKFTMENFMKFGCTKSEGLLSAMSLAICAVFGDNMKKKIIEGSERIGGDDTSWRLITALEMLYNLKMHQDNHIKTKTKYIKTKYIRRLEDTLVASKFRCVKDMTGSLKTVPLIRKLGRARKNFLKLKTAKLAEVLSVISVSVTDEVNGVVCSNKGEKELSMTTINENIQEIEKRIKSWAAGTTDSPADDGESSEDDIHTTSTKDDDNSRTQDDADSGTIALYHQFVNPIDQ
jgi:hypothetical protein